MYVCIVIELIFVCSWYSAVNVCMYVCMYVWSVDYVANLMLLFCFMCMQGEQLLSASTMGDMATVRRLLEEGPNLVRYKDPWVRRIEYYSTFACMYV